MELYHVINRGVDKRITFVDAQDYQRFVQNLYVYNTTEPTPHNAWTISSRLRKKQENKLVTIHAFCLMPNHYRLLLSEVAKEGISLFMKKVNMGYAKYFNERTKRTGSLWQGKYKAIHISEDRHFNYIPYYIHLNALDLTHPQWRKGLLKNKQEAVTALSKYKWSSHALFLEPEKIPQSVIDGSFYQNNLNQMTYLNEIQIVTTNADIADESALFEL